MRKPRPVRFLRSLRSRILLLALLVVVLLGAALTGFVLLLRQAQSTIIADSSSRLSNATNAFAKDYLSAVSASPAIAAALDEPLAPRADESLRRFTINAFRRDPGVEGGFYSASTQALLGYAFPTSDGPGPKQDIPPRERPTILSVAREAASTGRAASSTFRGEKDVILFHAVPIVIHGMTVGSVWGMRRLHDVDSGRDLRAILGLSGLALAALVCVGVAFWITRNVQSDVNTIQTRLQELEQDLSEPLHGQVSTAELNVIMAGINRLGISLKEKIAKERLLVERLHHKERLASLGQVAAGVAHELRNPLATIRLRTQMSLRSKDAEQHNRSAQLILEEIDRLSEVLDRLLSFSKPISLQVRHFDAVSLCRDVVDALGPEADRASVALTITASGPAPIEADPLKLRQVLENLVRNALESFDELVAGQKIIHVRVTTSAESACISVQDNGVGMSQEAAAKAFDPFFTTKARGTGLGLSIANEIVRAHGGTLELRPVQPRGTVVACTLPRLPDADGLLGKAK